MWHGGNNYERTARAAMTTWYVNDVCLRTDGTPNEPKYIDLNRLQHLVAEHSVDILI